MAKAPKPYSSKETAYQKKLRQGSKQSQAAHRKGYTALASPKGQQQARKARVASEKYRNSNWAIVDDFASELLKELTSAREIKKALYGKATKGDFARIAGNAATYMVPYSKLNKGVNAIVGGKAVKTSASAAKAKSKAKGAGKVKSSVRATAAGTGAAGRKTVRGTGKLAAAGFGATAADKVGQSTVNKVTRNKKKR